MMRKVILNLISAYLILVVSMTALLTAVYCIPKDSIHDNVVKSCAVLAEEGNYRILLPGFELSKLDNFTDALMFSTAWAGDCSHPYTSAMESPLYDVKNENFINNISKDYNEGYRYLPKYWNGYMIIFKPLLLFFDYKQLRIINCVVFAFVVMLCFFLLYRHVSKFTAWSFIALYVILGFFIVPINFQFSNAFYLAMLSMIAVILCRKFTGKISGYGLMFFVLGGVTAFVDYFTIPMFIMGMPIIVYMLLHRPKKIYKTLFLLMAFWGLGYCSIWVSKWILCTLTTDVNAFKNAFEAVTLRLSDFSDTSKVGYTGGLKQSLIYIYITYNRYVILLFTILMALILYFMTYRKSGFIMQYGWLIITAAMPLLYYAAINNHFMIHYWFSWRSVFITAWSILILLHEYRRFPA